jgi:hypothetical protein
MEAFRAVWGLCFTPNPTQSDAPLGGPEVQALSSGACEVLEMQLNFFTPSSGTDTPFQERELMAQVTWPPSGFSGLSW